MKLKESDLEEVETVKCRWYCKCGRKIEGPTKTKCKSNAKQHVNLKHGEELEVEEDEFEEP